MPFCDTKSLPMSGHAAPASMPPPNCMVVNFSTATKGMLLLPDDIVPPSFLAADGRRKRLRSPARHPLLDRMHVVQHARRHADDQDGEVALRLVANAPRHIDHDAFVQLDLLAVEQHGALASDDVVELVR